MDEELRLVRLVGRGGGEDLHWAMASGIRWRRGISSDLGHPEVTRDLGWGCGVAAFAGIDVEGRGLPSFECLRMALGV